MATVWFVILAVMLAVYTVLDGYDFGVGALYLYVARTRSGAAHRAGRHRSACGTGTKCG